MKNQELFDKTVAILVKAYQNDTLRHGTCEACAVGNLIAANNGIKITESETGKLVWSETAKRATFWHYTLCCDNFVAQGERDLLSTGYRLEDLSLIESAFESTYGLNMEEKRFKGLMAVVDVLMQIHEATVEQAETAKALFVLA